MPYRICLNPHYNIMARKERISKGRTMTPNYFVFCEGDTEVLYVEMLRSFYRLPIHIIAKKTLLNVTPSLVERCKGFFVQTKRDRTYLMYDLDVATMLERLRRVPNSTLLCSNPCFEFWLLLHYTEQKTSLSSNDCVKRLATFIKQYKKGTLQSVDKQTLLSLSKLASNWARQLHEYDNPSSTVYRLIDDLGALYQKI